MWIRNKNVRNEIYLARMSGTYEKIQRWTFHAAREFSKLPANWNAIRPLSRANAPGKGHAGHTSKNVDNKFERKKNRCMYKRNTHSRPYMIQHRTTLCPWLSSCVLPRGAVCRESPEREIAIHNPEYPREMYEDLLFCEQCVPCTSAARPEDK